MPLASDLIRVPSALTPVRALLVAVALLTANACGDTPTDPPPSGNGMTIVAGAGQTIPAGTAASTIAALVTDAHGTPVPNVPVAFAFPTLDMRFPDTPIRIVNTGADGVARLEGWVPSVQAGSRTLSATREGGGTVTFSVTFAVGAPTRIAFDYLSYWKQTGAAIDLTATVYDANFNRVAGRPIQFTSGAGGGSVSDASKSTDASGGASTRWTLGTTIGTYTLTATSGSLSTTVTAHAISGPPVGIDRISGDGQVVTVGGSVRDSLKVRVMDAAGLPVPGVLVRWTPDAGSAAFSCDAATDSLGTTGCPRWRLSQAGPLGISADIGTASTRFTATALAAPVSFGFVAAPDSTKEVRTDTELPDAVIVEARLADGSPAAGYPVTFTTSGSDAKAVIFTGVDGRASTRWRTGRAPGRATLTATLDGVKTIAASVPTYGPPVFSVLFAGRSHTCGYLGLPIFCWGSNSVGQAGGPAGGSDRLLPELLVSNWGAGVSTFTALGDHSCSLTDLGFPLGLRLYCWGLGPDGAQSYSKPTAVELSAYRHPGLEEGRLDGAIARRTEGALHACVQTDRSTVYCVGKNDHGQLGDGTMIDRALAVAVPGIAGKSTLVLGESHTCALGGGGALLCWGRNDAGQLGDGTTTDRATPVAVVGGLTFTAVAAGVAHTCGITPAGRAYCWGSNANGQLGIGTIGGSSSAPTPVAGGYIFTRIALGDHHTCGTLTSGLAYCWGRNDHGQLGDGTRIDRAAPTPQGDYHP